MTNYNILFLFFTELVTLLIFMVFSISLEYLTPNIRIPDINDKTIGFPFTNYEIITGIMLPIFNMGIPTIVILSLAFINRFKSRRFFFALLGLYFTISLAFLITNMLKSPVGRLRPDFLSRCNPDPTDLPKIVCQGDLKRITEGRRSFPSGHSSSSFGGLGFTALFLAEQFKTFDGSGQIYRFLIFIIPLLVASLVSISRIFDYRHHWQDVLVGILIGCVSALAGFFYFLPVMVRKNSPDQDNEIQNHNNQLSTTV